MKVVAEEATLQCLELLKENLMEIREFLLISVVSCT